MVISGELQYTDVDTHKLEAGSYFGSSGEFGHQVETLDDGVTIYIRSDAEYQVHP